jgi:hypothetical protein
MNHSSTLESSSRLPVSVYGTGGTIISLESFLGSLIRIIIRLPGGSRYYHLRQDLRIYLQILYLLALTYYSVSTQIFHYFVIPSLIEPVW